jgi:hypothetical protein
LHSGTAAAVGAILASNIFEPATSGIPTSASFASASFGPAIAAFNILALAGSTAHCFAAAEAISCTGVTADASA